MYVCICNALTDCQINDVIDGGECDALAVHPQLGCATRCGKCISTITDMMDARQQAAAGEMGLAAE